MAPSIAARAALPREMRATRILPVVLAGCLSALCLVSADQAQIQCTPNTSPGTLWSCQAFDSLVHGQNKTYTLNVDADSAAYQQYDINITLTPLSGDADLFVNYPTSNLSFISSTRNVGPDIVFIYRTELAAGQIFVTVVGYSGQSSYRLDIEYVQPQRSLRPQALLAMGEMMVSCCAVDPMACPELKALYPQLQSADPNNNPNYCYMHGNVCSRDGFLQELSLPGVGLSCDFPYAQLAIFKHLRRIDLSGNAILTNVTKLGITVEEMPAMQYLDLSLTLLEGPLNQACNLTTSKAMASINFGHNSLSGSIPPCITNLPALAELHLDFNSLVGTIPPFPKASPLVYFTAAMQGGLLLAGLQGKFPDSLSTLKALTYLDVGGNMLTGSLPATLPTGLWEFRASQNFLVGSIPASYGNLQQMSSFEVAGNSLTGPVPPALAALPALRLLDLRDNQLAQALPSDWSNADFLTVLLADRNQLTGTVPSSLASLSALVVLNLRSNQLSGDLGEFAFKTEQNRADLNSRLRFLSFANNSLTGDLNQASGLSHLGLFSNVPLGSFSEKSASGSGGGSSGNGTGASSGGSFGLDASTILRTFDLSDNQFKGEFPGWLVESVVEAAEPVIVRVGGTNQLTCPAHGFPLDEAVPPNRLDGLFCYPVSTYLAITPQSQMVNVTSLVYVPHPRLSGGAIFGIVLAVLVGVAAIVGGLFWLVKRHRAGQAGGGSFERFDAHSGGSATNLQAAGNSATSARSKFAAPNYPPSDRYYSDQVQLGTMGGGGGAGAQGGYKVNLKSGSTLQF